MPKSEPTFKPWHWILEDLTLTPYEKLVALVLLKHTNASGSAWPSRDRIALMCGISIASVDRALKRLQARKIAYCVSRTGETRRIVVWKIGQLQPSMFTSRTVLDHRRSDLKECRPTDEISQRNVITQTTSTPGNVITQTPKEVHNFFEKGKSSKPSLNRTSHQDQMLRGDAGDRLDDFRKNVLSRCEDADGILATALDIIVDRVRQSGVNVNSPKYLEVALANFDFQQGEDREQLMQRLRRRSPN